MKSLGARSARSSLRGRIATFPEEREAAAVSEVLVLLDGTAPSEAILAHALELCRLTGAACTLLQVIVPELVLIGVAVPVALADPHATVADERKVEAYLETHADRFRDEHVPVTTATIRHSDAANGVLEYCASHPVSLIATGTRGTSGIERAILGSTTGALLRKSHLPLLVTATRSGAE
jgi:nucleotide-binding universal stress UspA family protein